MVKTRIHDDQGVDEDFLSEKELNDFFETVVITGTNGRDDTELITTFDGYFPGRGLITAGSGIIVTTGTNFVEISQGPSTDKALVGSDGITVVSGANSIDIQGFRTEFVSASGSLQDQIGTGGVTSLNSLAGVVDIIGKGEVVVTIEGQNVVVSGTTPGSGTATTVSGCFTYVQSTASDTWNVNHSLASVPINCIVVNDSDFEVIPDNFKINDADNVTITFVSPQSGKAYIFPCISGAIETALGGGSSGGGGGGTQALIGTDGITIISGSSFDTVQGFQTEFVSASGSLQSQLDATVSGINDVFAIRLDEVGQTTYIGEADPGSLDSSPVWRIKRMIETGPDIAITWAAGTSDFNDVWDDRLILSYS